MNNDTLGYLRIVRDGEDCALRDITGDYVISDGSIEVADEWWMEKRPDHVVTPVRLEPCAAPDWRTDVENAPRDGTRILFGNATLQIWFGARWIEDRFPDDDDESGWKDDEGDDVSIAMTHWMPIPALPDREAK